MESRGDVVSLALRRRDALDALRVPRDKRDLVGELDVSRSTVDRAIRDLEVAGLVVWDDGSYRLTAVGRALADAVERLVAVGDGAAALAEHFEAVSGEFELPPDLLADASVTPVADADGRLPDAVRQRLREADDVGLAAPEATAPALLAAFRELADASLEVVLEAAFVDELAEQLPGLARWLAATERTATLAGSTPPVAVAIVHDGEETSVLVVGHDSKGRASVCLECSTDAVVEWGRDLLERALDGAEPVFDDDHVDESNEPRTTDALAREGIVELTPSYFAARNAAPLPTGWRAGLALTEVAAGHAVERTVHVDCERRQVTDVLRARLEDGTDVALVGPPGSGKSTVCKTVACEWYRERGPVFYRESGRGEPFESWPALADRLHSIDGHALVVVEDAVRPAANAVFRLRQAFPDGNVSFLLDARDREWSEPKSDDLPEGFRHGIDVVSMPTLDEHDTERLLERFRSATGGADVSASELLEDVDATAERPARLLCVLHRLSLLADPLGADEQTSLDDAVREAAAELRAAGPLATDAGVLVNLCNVAGVEVTPDLVAALAPEDPDAVRAALERLEGRVLFEDPASESYRTVHEAWSGQYLRAATERDDATERVGDCLTRLLALADDADAREAVADAFENAPTMDRIAADPEAWADAVVEQLFAAGLERPALAPLFGESDPDPVTFPDACDPETVVGATEKRARMARYASDLERAEREYERLGERAAALLDADEATRYAARRETGLGNVARKRSDFEAAAGHFERAVELYERIDDDHGVADARKNLGTVALLRGDLETAESELSWSHDRLDELGDDRLASYALFNLASVLEERGDLDGAIERYDECLEYYRRSGRDADEADVHLNLGVALVVRGDVDSAFEHYKRALGIYRNVGDVVGVANALQNHGEVALRRGELDAAAEYYERSRERYEEAGEEWGQIQCRVGLARISLERGDRADAERAAAAALEQFESLGDPRGTMDARRVLARALCERGAFDDAEAHLAAAVETGREAGYSHRTGRLLLAYGHLERDRGDRAAARERYREAVESLEAAGALGDLADARRRLAETCEAMGDENAATEHRRRVGTLASEVDFELSMPTD